MKHRFAVLIRAGRQLDLRDDLGELPVVEIEVEDRDLLVDIAKKAQKLHGVKWKWTYQYFVTDPDSRGRRYQTPYLSAFVAEDGALTWTKRGLEGVRVSDLLRSREEGIFEGDPWALLVEEPLGGDGVLPVWDDLIRLLIHLGQIGAGVAAVHQAATGLIRILKQFRKQWELRGAMPHSFFEVILQEAEWDHGRLARYLGTNLSITVDLLEYLGYEQDSATGLFLLSDDEEKAQLRQAIEHAILSGDPRESRRSFWRVQGRFQE